MAMLSLGYSRVTRRRYPMASRYIPMAARTTARSHRLNRAGQRQIDRTNGRFILGLRILLLCPSQLPKSAKKCLLSRPQLGGA